MYVYMCVYIYMYIVIFKCRKCHLTPPCPVRNTVKICVHNDSPMGPGMQHATPRHAAPRHATPRHAWTARARS